MVVLETCLTHQVQEGSMTEFVEVGVHLAVLGKQAVPVTEPEVAVMEAHVKVTANLLLHEQHQHFRSLPTKHYAAWDRLDNTLSTFMFVAGAVNTQELLVVSVSDAVPISRATG